MMVSQAPDIGHGPTGFGAFFAGFRSYFDAVIPCYVPFLPLGVRMFSVSLYGAIEGLW